MANAVRLRNAGSGLRLRRYWISFDESVIIGGETPEEAGVLTVGRDGLRARYFGRRKTAESIEHGNNIAIAIDGQQLLIGVAAVEDERMLVTFGIPRGSKASVILATRAAPETEAASAVSAGHH